MGGSSIHVALRQPGLPDFSACNIETERPGYEASYQYQECIIERERRVSHSVYALYAIPGNGS